MLALQKAARYALDALNAERQDDFARISVLDQPRYLPPFMVVRNLPAGRYHRFQRWKSAAKDLLA